MPDRRSKRRYSEKAMGPWKMGDDALAANISSATFGCGGHAGDADVMSATR